MTWQAAPYALPLFAAAALTGILALYAFRRAARPGALTFGLLMAVMSEWAAFYAVELLAPSLPGKLLAAKLQYLGIAALPALWLAFALIYIGRTGWLTRGRRLLLAAPGSLTFGLALTNEWHHLIWTEVGLDPGGAPALYIAGHGAWFWVHTLISYAFILIGVGLYALAFARAARPYRQQAAVMLLGALAPLAGNALYLAGLSPIPWLDLTPFIFALSGALLALGFFCFGLLELMPIAAPVVIEHLQDAVIVTDILSRVVDLNPAARRLFGAEGEIIGRNLLDVLWPMQSTRDHAEIAEGQMEVEIGEGEARRIFQLTITPIRDNRWQLAGRLLLLRDITREHALLTDERRRAERQRRLAQTAGDLMAAPDTASFWSTLMQSARRLLTADRVAVYLYDRAADRLTCPFASGLSAEYIAEVNRLFHDIPGARLLNRPEPVTIADAQTHPATAPLREFILREGFHSYAVFPLVTLEGIFGALAVYRDALRPFSEDELAVGQTLAHIVTSALQNLRLLEDEREQRALAEALCEVGLSLSATLDFETVLDRVLEQIGRVVPYDSASIMLVEALPNPPPPPSSGGEVEGGGGQMGRIRVARTRGYEQFGAEVAREIGAIAFDVAATANLRRMAETGRPLIIPDTAADPGWIKVQASAHVRSWAGAPVLVQGEVAAFFSLDKVEPGFYRPKHAERLAVFAGQVALALQNARLFEAAQRRAEERRLLLSAAREFSTGLDQNAILLTVARQMVNLLNAPDCAILRWERAADRLVTLLDYDLTTTRPHDAPGTAYPLADYPASRRVLESREPLIIRADDTEADPAERAILARYGYGMLLMTPLIAGDQVFGLAELYREAGAPAFTPAEAQLAQGLAAQAATALENARLHAEVKALAITDDLTGLYNRRHFFKLAARELQRARRFGHPLAALMLDLDHFKRVNDTHGHAVGDEVLREVARRCAANLREVDILGRYGGEEFAALLPETDLPAALYAAERLRQHIVETPVSTSAGLRLSITLSFGVAEAENGLSDVAALLARADAALYAAKRSGRNKVCAAGQA